MWRCFYPTHTYSNLVKLPVKEPGKSFAILNKDKHIFIDECCGRGTKVGDRLLKQVHQDTRPLFCERWARRSPGQKGTENSHSSKKEDFLSQEFHELKLREPWKYSKSVCTCKLINTYVLVSVSFVCFTF